jgi:hypothetical protein
LGEFGSLRTGARDTACLPLFFSWVATDVSFPLAGVVNDRQNSSGRGGTRFFNSSPESVMNLGTIFLSVILNICNKTSPTTKLLPVRLVASGCERG